MATPFLDWLEENVEPGLRRRWRQDIKPLLEAASGSRVTPEGKLEVASRVPILSLAEYLGDLTSRYGARPALGWWTRKRADVARELPESYLGLPWRYNQKTGQTEVLVPTRLVYRGPVESVVRQAWRGDIADPQAQARLLDAALGGRAAAPAPGRAGAGDPGVWIPRERYEELRAELLRAAEAPSYTASYREVEGGPGNQLLDEVLSDPTWVLAAGLRGAASGLKTVGLAARAGRLSAAERAAVAGRALSTERVIAEGLGAAESLFTGLARTAQAGAFAWETYERLAGLPLEGAVRLGGKLARKVAAQLPQERLTILRRFVRLVRVIEKLRNHGISSIALTEGLRAGRREYFEDVVVFSRADGGPLTDADRNQIKEAVLDPARGVALSMTTVLDGEHQWAVRLETDQRGHDFFRTLVEMMAEDGETPPVTVDLGPSRGPGGAGTPGAAAEAAPEAAGRPSGYMASIPDYLRGEIDRRYRIAERLGLVDEIEDLAARGLVASEIAERIQDRVPGDVNERPLDLVRAVRVKLSIPSQAPSAPWAGGSVNQNSEEFQEFLAWRADYWRRRYGQEAPPIAQTQAEARGKPAPARDAGESPAEATPEAGELPAEAAPEAGEPPAEAPPAGSSLEERRRLAEMPGDPEYWWQNHYPYRPPRSRRLGFLSGPQDEGRRGVTGTGVVQSPTVALSANRRGVSLDVVPAFANPLEGQRTGETAFWEVQRQELMAAANAFDRIYLEQYSAFPVVGQGPDWTLLGPDHPGSIAVHPLVITPDFEAWRVGLGSRQANVYLGAVGVGRANVGVVLVWPDAEEPVFYYHRALWEAPEDAVKAAAADLFDEIVEARLASLRNLRRDVARVLESGQVTGNMSLQDLTRTVRQVLGHKGRGIYYDQTVARMILSGRTNTGPVPFLVSPDHAGYRLRTRRPREGRVMPRTERDRQRLARELEDTVRSVTGLRAQLEETPLPEATSEWPGAAQANLAVFSRRPEVKPETAKRLARLVWGVVDRLVSRGDPTPAARLLRRLGYEVEPLGQLRAGFLVRVGDRVVEFDPAFGARPELARQALVELMANLDEASRSAVRAEFEELARSSSRVGRFAELPPELARPEGPLQRAQLGVTEPEGSRQSFDYADISYVLSKVGARDGIDLTPEQVIEEIGRVVPPHWGYRYQVIPGARIVATHNNEEVARFYQALRPGLEASGVEVSPDGFTLTLSRWTVDGIANFLVALRRVGINAFRKRNRAELGEVRARTIRGIQRELAALADQFGELGGRDLEQVLAELERQTDHSRVIDPRAIRAKADEAAEVPGERTTADLGDTDQGAEVVSTLQTTAGPVQDVGLRELVPIRPAQVNLEYLATSRTGALLSAPSPRRSAVIASLRQATGGRLREAMAAAIRGRPGRLLDALLLAGARIVPEGRGLRVELAGRAVSFPASGYRPSQLAGLLRALEPSLSEEELSTLLTAVAQSAARPERQVVDEVGPEVRNLVSDRLGQAITRLASGDPPDPPGLVDIAAAAHLAAAGSERGVALLARWLAPYGFQLSDVGLLVRVDGPPREELVRQLVAGLPREVVDTRDLEAQAAWFFGGVEGLLDPNVVAAIRDRRVKQIEAELNQLLSEHSAAEIVSDPELFERFARLRDERDSPDISAELERLRRGKTLGEILSDRDSLRRLAGLLRARDKAERFPALDEQTADAVSRVLTEAGDVLNEFAQAQDIELQALFDDITRLRVRIEDLRAEGAEGSEREIADLTRRLEGLLGQRDRLVDGEVGRTLATTLVSLAMGAIDRREAHRILSSHPTLANFEAVWAQALDIRPVIPQAPVTSLAPSDIYGIMRELVGPAADDSQILRMLAEVPPGRLTRLELVDQPRWYDLSWDGKRIEPGEGPVELPPAPPVVAQLGELIQSKLALVRGASYRSVLYDVFDAGSQVRNLEETGLTNQVDDEEIARLLKLEQRFEDLVSIFDPKPEQVARPVREDLAPVLAAASRGDAGRLADWLEVVFGDRVLVRLEGGTVELGSTPIRAGRRPEEILADIERALLVAGIQPEVRDRAALLARAERALRGPAEVGALRRLREGTTEPTTATTPKRRADKADVEARGIPEFPPEGFEGFALADGTRFASGYQRVVFGDRGPYVEFSPDQILVPLERRFDREAPDDAFYEWRYPRGHPNVKVYAQRRTVGYADYRPGMIYVDPKLLTPLGQAPGAGAPRRLREGEVAPPPPTLPAGVTKRPRKEPWPRLEAIEGFDFAKVDPYVLNVRHIPKERLAQVLDDPNVVYVGRPHRLIPTKYVRRFGNRHRLSEDTTAERLRALTEYAKDLLANPAMMERVRRELRGKLLLDWCSPQPCHAHVLAWFANGFDRGVASPTEVVPASTARASDATPALRALGWETEKEPVWNPVFSNFAATPITVEGVTYPTAEHYYQARKFDPSTDQGIIDQILATSDPKQAKRISYQHQDRWRPDWESIRLRVMAEALVAKAQSSPRFRLALLETGTAPIVERSDVDHFWGATVRDDGTIEGRNHLGRMLTRLRDRLRELGEPEPRLPESAPAVLRVVEALARRMDQAPETLSQLALAHWLDEFVSLSREALRPLRAEIERPDLVPRASYHEPILTIFTLPSNERPPEVWFGGTNGFQLIDRISDRSRADALRGAIRRRQVLERQLAELAGAPESSAPAPGDLERYQELSRELAAAEQRAGELRVALGRRQDLAQRLAEAGPRGEDQRLPVVWRQDLVETPAPEEPDLERELAEVEQRVAELRGALGGLPDPRPAGVAREEILGDLREVEAQLRELAAPRVAGEPPIIALAGEEVNAIQRRFLTELAYTIVGELGNLTEGETGEAVQRVVRRLNGLVRSFCGQS